MKLLVVDDDRDFLAALALSLRTRGFEVEEVRSYSDALDAVGDREHDAVVSDIDLGPGPSGLDLLGYIRQRAPELPVILVTGTVRAETLAEARGLAATAVLEKPISVRQLAAMIER